MRLFQVILIVWLALMVCLMLISLDNGGITGWLNATN